MDTADTELGLLLTSRQLQLLRVSHVLPMKTADLTKTDYEVKPKRIRIFPPDGIVASVWSCVMLLTTIYQVLTIPYLMAFEGSETLTTMVIDFVCFLFFLVDIAMSFNMSFYQRGNLCTDRKLIVKRYLRGWFFFDCISTFPYNWVLQNPFEVAEASNFKAPTLIRIVKISRLLRSFRILRLIKVGQHFIVLQQKLSNELSFLITFFSIITVMGCIAHWAACGFYFLSTISETPQNWLTEASMDNARDSEKYVMALYWAVTTLTTTGFGDVIPVNSTERAYGITLMVFSAGVFSFLIGKIGIVIADVEKSVNEHKALVMSIARYLKDAKVPDNLSYRTLRYVDYKWETRRNRKFIDKRALGHLSEPLKDEVIVHIFGTILGKAPFMSRFEHGFVGQLAKCVGPEVYAVSDVIFSEKFTSTDIFFLEKGKVEMYHEATNFCYTVLQNFGEIAFLTAARRTASARCVQYAEVLKITRSDFLNLIKENPTANYTFRTTEDIIRSGNLFELGIYCYLCEEFTHLAWECRKMRLEVDRCDIQRRWLQGFRGSRKVIRSPSLSEPPFKRKIRKVNRTKQYSLKSVKAKAPSSRPKVVVTHADSSSSEQEEVAAPFPDACGFLQPPEAQEDGAQGPFSFFRGVKTVPLSRCVRGGFMARRSTSENSPR